MKKVLMILVTLVVFETGVIAGGYLNPVKDAKAVTNRAFQATQDALGGNQQAIMKKQDEIAAAVGNVLTAVNKLNGDLAEIMAGRSENKALIQRVLETTQQITSSQSRDLRQLAAKLDRSNEKNLKVLEMIYRILGEKSK